MSKEIADRFRAMADLIEKNAGNPFGGAFVVAAPGTGDVKEGLMLSQHADPVQFWAVVKGLADAAVTELQAQHHLGGQFRPR